MEADSIKKLTELDQLIDQFKAVTRGLKTEGLPDVANSIGMRSSDTIDALYDDKRLQMSRVLEYLNQSKKISTLIKKPPRDALTTIRLAEI